MEACAAESCSTSCFMAPTLLCMSCMSRISTEIRLCTTVVVAGPALPVLARLFFCCDCSSRASADEVSTGVLVVIVIVIVEVVEAVEA